MVVVGLAVVDLVGVRLQFRGRNSSPSQVKESPTADGRTCCLGDQPAGNRYGYTVWMLGFQGLSNTGDPERPYF